MIQFETRLADVIKRTPDVKSFRFDVREDAEFEAGQFFFVTIRDEGQEITKHFSFSNSPTEKGYIEFTKRLTGSQYSNALDRLSAGDWAKIKMPYGVFLLEKKYPKIALLSGGIGITPFRSMCKYATDNNFSNDIVLLYGNNEEKSIIFRKDFDAIQSENKNFQVIYTLTSPDIDKKSWGGRAGFIDEGMIKEELPDYKERIFYIAGPPLMVGKLTGMLSGGLGIKKDNIRSENFTGYGDM